MSYATPWSTDVLTIGRPTVTFAPRRFASILNRVSSMATLAILAAIGHVLILFETIPAVQKLLVVADRGCRYGGE